MDCISESYDDSADVENKYQILEPCNSSNFDGDSGPPKKRPKTGRSNAWNHFVKIGVAQDGKEKCKCMGCGKVYTCGSKVGTTHLNHHIPKCPMNLKCHNVGNVMMIDHAEKLEVRKLDQKIVRELITQMIIKHDLPFQFVEWDGFRAFTKYVSSDEATCVSRDTVTDDVMKVYLLEKEKLKKQLARISGRVCLTFRCWTSGASRGYITLTAHYMDENRKLNAKLLNFCHLKPPHTGFELSRKVYGYLREWGIQKKIFSVTVDNASSKDDFQNLKEMLRLSNSLLSNGEFFRTNCCAHVLDLIAQESLKVISGVLHKIRKSVKYVSLSNSRLKQFYQCVEEVGGIDNRDGLHLDVSDKWIATYIMLESAIKYRRAFERLCSNDMRYYRHYPSNEEWEKGEMICEFLRIFYQLTNMISGSTYPMTTTYFLKTWRIEVALKRMKLSEDHEIRDMASKMLDEFDKYLREYRMILAFACVLDPHLKFDFLEFTYYKLDPDMNIVKEKVSNVRKALSALFNEYAKEGASTSSNSSMMDSCLSTSTYNGEMESFIPAEYLEFCEKEIQKKYAAGMSQLDLYLEEPSLSFINALDYWKNNVPRFGTLARMARDILSIPIITAASESAFSIGGCNLNKYGSCMLSEHLQALVCSHNWLFGFSSGDRFGHVAEETKKIDINLSKQDSNVIVSYESESED